MKRRLKNLDLKNGKDVKKGDIFLANLGKKHVGYEKSGIRPVVVIQNNMGNKFSPTLIIAVLETKSNGKVSAAIKKTKKSGLKKDSYVSSNQVRTIDRERLLRYLGEVSKTELENIDTALKHSLSLKKDNDIVKNETSISRGEVFYVDFGDVRSSEIVGSEQAGLRPAVIIQNDIGNHLSETTVVAMVTTKNNNDLPVHYSLTSKESCFKKDSTIMLEQIRTVSNKRIKDSVGTLTEKQMSVLTKKLTKSLGM